MIGHTELITAVNDYVMDCSRRNKEPSYRGMGQILGITTQTVINICTGYYANGKPYTDTPHPTRCVDNMDFQCIREVFLTTRHNDLTHKKGKYWIL